MLFFKFHHAFLLSFVLLFLVSCASTDKKIPAPLTQKQITAAFIKSLTQKINLNRNDEDAYFSRATLYYHQQHYKKAKADYLKATQLNHLFVNAYGMLGWILIKQGEFDKAEVYCRKAYNLDKFNSAWTLNLGHVAMLRGHTKTARKYYKRALLLISDQATFEAEVVADFDFFIKKGWKINVMREQRSWMIANFANKQQKNKLLSRRE
ncbi:MAG: tetratricopeptide repeat protein [Methylococcaceae bacterium]|nr:tetratricopeptide repeat protein [Methylococcaceae bacterium]